MAPMLTDSESQQGDSPAKPYVPTLGYHRLTALYDRVVAVTMREATWWAAFVRLVAPRAGESILDIGCGSGALAVALAQVESGAQITGIDPEGAMLEVERQRATATGGHDCAGRWPCAGGGSGRRTCRRRFDTIDSNLVFHQLDAGIKRAVLGTMLGLLRRRHGRVNIGDKCCSIQRADAGLRRSEERTKRSA